MINLVSTVIRNPSPHVHETSHGKTIHFPSMYPRHLHWYVRVVYWTSSCCADSSHILCLMSFVFLGSEFCLQLPSDSTSRWTPLLLASGWQLQASTADFHRLVNRHAWRTQKSSLSKAAFYLFISLIPQDDGRHNPNADQFTCKLHHRLSHNDSSSYGSLLLWQCKWPRQTNERIPCC